MSDRCYGGCCRRIWLPFETRAEIASSGDPDAAQIAAMLEPEADQFKAQDGLPISMSKGLFYRCKNLDEETGNCTIYDTRPGMCRDFPNGYQCPVSSCESKSARALPIHPNRPTRAARRAAAKAAPSHKRQGCRALDRWHAAEDAAGDREPGTSRSLWQRIAEKLGLR